MERRRQDVITELLETEANYVVDLGIIVNEFLEPIRARGLLSRDEILELFSNVQQIREFNLAFLEALKSAYSSSGSDMDVGLLFYERRDMFKLYATHCSNMSIIHKLVESFKQNPEKLEFRDFLNSMLLSKVCRKLPLESFLISPMQRITKYPLILRELRETYPPESNLFHHVEQAQECIKASIDLLNDRTRQVENIYNLRALQKRLRFQSNCAVPEESRDIVQMGRHVVAESVVEGVGHESILGRKKLAVQVWVLFSDILLIGEKDSGIVGNSSSTEVPTARSARLQSPPSYPIEVRAIVPLTALAVVKDESGPGSAAAPSGGPAGSGQRHLCLSHTDGNRVKFFAVIFNSDALGLKWLNDLTGLGVASVSGRRGELKKTLSQGNIGNLVAKKLGSESHAEGMTISSTALQTAASQNSPTLQDKSARSRKFTVTISKPEAAQVASPLSREDMMKSNMRTCASIEIESIEHSLARELEKLYAAMGSSDTADAAKAKIAIILQQILQAILVD